MQEFVISCVQFKRNQKRIMTESAFFLQLQSSKKIYYYQLIAIYFFAFLHLLKKITPIIKSKIIGHIYKIAIAIP